MYCSNCGKPIDENSKFCQHCGQANTTTQNTNSLAGITIENPIKSTSIVKSKNKKWIFAVCGILVVALIAIFTFGGNDGVTQKVEKLLEYDLGTSVTITKLYYNKDKQGCLVEFTSKASTDVAAVHLDTGKIEYQSEFDYYSNMAEKLRKQKPINEQELHKCNQKILECADLTGWKFTISLNGATKENGWERIK